MELGLFQLESLLISRSAFAFLDLRSQNPQNEPALPAELQAKISKAVPVATGEVIKYLQQIQHGFDQPLVLLCQNGEVSQKVGGQLEAAGYLNVYIIAGGVDGLLSEF